jgi:hypothetical protein
MNRHSRKKVKHAALCLVKPPESRRVDAGYLRFGARVGLGPDHRDTRLSLFPHVMEGCPGYLTGLCGLG